MNGTERRAVGVLTMDDTYRITYWNERAATLLAPFDPPGESARIDDAVSSSVASTLRRAVDDARDRDRPIRVELPVDADRLFATIHPADDAIMVVLSPSIADPAEDAMPTRVLSQILPDSVVIRFDEELRCVETNAAGGAPAGVDVEGATGRPLAEVFPPSDRPPLSGALEAALDGEGAFPEVTWNDRIYSVVTAPLVGRSSGVAVVRDVTELRSARRELEQQEERFRQLAEHISEVFWMVDVETGERLYVSPAFEEVWGVSRDRLFEDPADRHAFRDTIVPEDRERVVDQLDRRLEDPERADEYHVDYRIERPDGTIRWICDQANPVRDENGDVYRLVGIAADITDRKRIEAELRRERDLTEQIVNTSPVGIHVVDGSGTIVYGNDRAAEILQTAPDERVGTALDERPWTFVDGDGEPLSTGADPFHAVRERDEPVYDVRRTVRLPSGERRWLTYSGAPLRDGSGSFDGAVLTIEDATGRRSRERTLTALHEATQGMMLAESREEICERAVEAATDALNLSLVGFFLFDPESYTLRPVAYTEDVESIVGEPPVFGEDGDESLIWNAFVDGNLAVYDDVRDQPAVYDSDTVFRSELIVPLGNHGVFVTGSTRVGAFDDTDVGFARLFADNTEAALDRAERESLLRERERELRRKHDELERLNHVTEVMRDVTGAIVRASSHEEIVRTVCERLATTDPYCFAWIADRCETNGTLSPRAWAGIDRSSLEGLELRIDPDGRDGIPTPATAAAREREPVVVRDVLGDDGYEPRRSDALERNYRSIAAVPIVHRDRLHGVLTVSADRGNAFDERERSVLTELGETVGYAIDATEKRAALVSDNLTELQLATTDAGLFHVWLSARANCRVEHRGIVPRDDGTILYFASVTGASADRIRSLAADAADVDEVRYLSGDGETALFQFSARSPSFVEAIAERGAVLRALSAKDGEGRLTVECTPDVDVRGFVDAFRARYPETELTSRHSRGRPPTTRQDFRATLTDRLTDRQLEMLQAGYFSGYFEEPRRESGREIADRMEINQSTFHRVLRAAQRTVFSALLEGDDRD